MAVAELKIAADEIAKGAIEYFSKNVKTFEDIRIAVAGLEAVSKPSPDFVAWTKQIEAMGNADGTFGTGSAKARETGSAAAALLRMGVALEKKTAVLAALRAGQRDDGGWSKGDGPSDLESTYRVMRTFFMLKESPDLEKLREFVDRCRDTNGEFTTQPGGTPDLGATYFATTILRWARLLAGEPALVETAGFTPIFNGHDLKGWEGDTLLWSVRNGMIVGTSPGLKHNDFLATEKTYGDFILKLTFRLIGDDSSNSGVQFRSVRIPGHEMSGYQADVGQGYWGCLYDESRRNRILTTAAPEAVRGLHKSDWNEYEIRAMGDQIRLSLNGIKSVDYRETDPNVAREGRIALQIHAGGPLVVQFKDVRIQALPRPSQGGPGATGFLLRTVKAGQEERKYTVFVPKSYDGTEPLPVILFLHGSGQRGDDGIACAQLGLGAAILQHQADFPAIAVFPQARKTWQADSDDASAALAALDDVLANYKCDRSRVVLTGVSMGGSGSWSLAAAHPERFAALVPVCGIGKLEIVPALKALPVWAFVGDADQEKTVLGIRSLIEALRAAGSAAKVTEYRGIGHNSWDRAYHDPALIAWMLAQSRR
jgi:acetyl esterase/lipase